MEEILIAVKNKEFDEDSALDIMLEFIEKSKVKCGFSAFLLIMSIFM